MPDPKPTAPPPPPPVFEPCRRWKLAPYLANLEPGGRPALTLDEVRSIIPYGWPYSPGVRLRESGYAFFKRTPRAHLTGESTIWARRAEDDEVRLGEAVVASVQHAVAKNWGCAPSTSWHLPPLYTGAGVLRRWRSALPGDKHESLRTIRGAHWAPGEELVLRTGTSPEEVSRLVRAWVKGWAP